MYDSRCEDLARVFLPTEPPADEEKVKALAEHIQEAIEDWLEGEGL
jgi:hypothetical protein